MSEEIDALIMQLVNPDSSLYKQLAAAYLPIIQLKLETYRKDFNELTATVMKDQDDYLAALCSYGLLPRVIYFQDSNQTLQGFDLQIGRLVFPDTGVSVSQVQDVTSPDGTRICIAPDAATAETFTKWMDQRYHTSNYTDKVHELLEHSKAMTDGIEEISSQMLKDLNEATERTIAKLVYQKNKNWVSPLNDPTIIANFMRTKYTKERDDMMQLYDLISVDTTNPDISSLNYSSKGKLYKYIWVHVKNIIKTIDDDLTVNRTTYTIPDLERYTDMYAQWLSCMVNPSKAVPIRKLKQFMPAVVRKLFDKCQNEPASRSTYNSESIKFLDLPDSLKEGHKFWSSLSIRDSLKREILEASKMVDVLRKPTAGDITQKRITKLVENLSDLKVKISGSARLPIRNNIAMIVKNFAKTPTLYATSYLNFTLLGPPGSGKSTVAKVLGKILADVGILMKGNYQEASRATLVGEHIGKTALKTRDVLLGSLESVLFIDEAYAVTQAGQSGEGEGRFDPYGIEAVNEIVGFLDKHRGQISVIAAGYEQEMEDFWFAANPGLDRRFPFKWTLSPYSADDLYNILSHMLVAASKQNKKDLSLVTLLSPTGRWFLTHYLQTFPELFINQAGDIETLKDGILNKFMDQGQPLDAVSVKDQLKFVTERALTQEHRTREGSPIFPDIKQYLDNVENEISMGVQTIAPYVRRGIQETSESMHIQKKRKLESED